MPAISRFLRTAAKTQVRNLRNLLAGWELEPITPGATTLDPDDLKLANQLLTARSAWRDQSVTETFERKFSKWNGSKYAVAFSSGRAALSACISALGLQPGDEVVIPGYSCIVVPNAFHFAGVSVVCCDIELDTYGPDINSIRKSYTNDTKAILVQHLYGLVCRDMPEILAFARDKGIFVIEDCAQSTGAEYEGVKVGNFGDVAFHSMDPSKPFNCTQGGIAVTNTPRFGSVLMAIRDSLSELSVESVEQRLHSIHLNYVCSKDPSRWWRKDWEMYRLGHFYHYGISADEKNGRKPSEYQCRLSPALSVVAINQLEKLDHYNRMRRENAKRWDKWCVSHGYKMAGVLPGSQPIYLRYPVIVSPAMKADRRWAYRTLGVAPGVWFESYFHPAAIHIDDVPNASIAVARCINFPTLF